MACCFAAASSKARVCGFTGLSRVPKCDVDIWEVLTPNPFGVFFVSGRAQSGYGNGVSIKGLVKVKGSWGMGGGLRGVASFSLSWDSVSIPVAMFPGARCLPRFGRSFDALPGAARSLLGSCLGLFLLSLGATVILVRAPGVSTRHGSGIRRRHARAGRVRLLAPSRPLSRLAAGLQQSIIT